MISNFLESANAMKQNLVQNALGLYNWQATKMTVKERLTFLFNNNILSDVTFVVGRDVHQQRIPAHRFVLSVGSAVFDAMFNRHSSKAGTSAIGNYKRENMHRSMYLLAFRNKISNL